VPSKSRQLLVLTAQLEQLGPMGSLTLTSQYLDQQVFPNQRQIGQGNLACTPG
jgi:hypothetical protein